MYNANMLKQEESKEVVSPSSRREKLRQTFDKFGFDNFDEVNSLEYILGFCIPHIEANLVANRLLEAFGSLVNILEAHPDKLVKILGVKKDTAYFLGFLRKFVSYYGEISSRLGKIRTTEEAIAHWQDSMKTLSKEELAIIALDTDGNILFEKKIKGMLRKVNVDLWDFVDTVMRVRAAHVVIAHNHPEANHHPSSGDVLFTRAIVNMLLPLGIEVMDHLIFSKKGGVFSFKEKGFLKFFVKEHKEYARTQDWVDYIA